MEPNKTMDRLRQVASSRKEPEAEASKRSYQEASRRRLLQMLEKKLRTSFIGALSQFETRFGRLWGHGKHEEDCTAVELEWRELWNLCRTDVLNNGNNQLRTVQAEVLGYTIAWNRFHTEIPVAKPGGKL